MSAPFPLIISVPGDDNKVLGGKSKGPVQAKKTASAPATKLMVSSSPSSSSSSTGLIRTTVDTHVYPARGVFAIQSSSSSSSPSWDASGDFAQVPIASAYAEEDAKLASAGFAIKTFVVDKSVTTISPGPLENHLAMSLGLRLGSDIDQEANRILEVRHEDGTLPRTYNYHGAMILTKDRIASIIWSFNPFKDNSIVFKPRPPPPPPPLPPPPPAAAAVPGPTTTTPAAGTVVAKKRRWRVRPCATLAQQQLSAFVSEQRRDVSMPPIAIAAPPPKPVRVTLHDKIKTGISRRWYGLSAVFAMSCEAQKNHCIYLESQITKSTLDETLFGIRSLLRKEDPRIMSVSFVRLVFSGDTDRPLLIPVPVSSMNKNKPICDSKFDVAMQAVPVVCRGTIVLAALLVETVDQLPEIPKEIADDSKKSFDFVQDVVETKILGGTGGIPSEMLREDLKTAFSSIWDSEDRLWAMLRNGMASQFYPARLGHVAAADFVKWWTVDLAASSADKDEIFPPSNPNRAVLEEQISKGHQHVDLNGVPMWVVRMALFERWWTRLGPTLTLYIKRTAITMARIWFIHIVSAVAFASSFFFPGSMSKVASCSWNSSDAFGELIRDAANDQVRSVISYPGVDALESYCSMDRINRFVQLSGSIISAVIRRRCAFSQYQRRQRNQDLQVQEAKRIRALESSIPISISSSSTDE